MNREDFMVWHPMPNLDGIYDIEYVENINGLDIWLIPDSPNGDLSTNHKVLVHFDSYQSYTCIDESYCDGFWIDSPEKAWTFYKVRNLIILMCLEVIVLFLTNVEKILFTML